MLLIVLLLLVMLLPHHLRILRHTVRGEAPPPVELIMMVRLLLAIAIGEDLCQCPRRVVVVTVTVTVVVMASDQQSAPPASASSRAVMTMITLTTMHSSLQARQVVEAGAVLAAKAQQVTETPTSMETIRIPACEVTPALAANLVEMLEMLSRLLAMGTERGLSRKLELAWASVVSVTRKKKLRHVWKA